MAPIGPVNSAFNLMSASPIAPADKSTPAALPDGLSAAPTSGANFNSMLDNLVSAVDGKETQANALTNQVMLGDSGQLHQSVIAMQEASTALSLMVTVRNKLVESYQQLMQMQV
jgi:flagellar hook-basal body complex protein FliE